MTGKFSCALATALSCSLICGCATNQGQKPPATIAQSVAPVLGWRLPKTVLDVTVTYVPKSPCKMDGKIPTIEVNTDVSVLARAVPDPDLGAQFPNGLVSIQPGDASRFWVDRSITYKIFPDSGGLLQSLSSHPVNEAGTIIGNFITGFVKLAGTAFGVAAAPALTSSPQCGTVRQVLDEIDKLKKQDPATAKDATDNGARIQALKDSITVTEKRTIDTATSAPNADGIVARILPTPSKAIEARWFAGEVKQDPKQEVDIKLDFKKAILLAPSIKVGEASTYHHQDLPPGALFRQAAYIPVTAEHGGKAFGEAKIVPFAQFGGPRAVPLTTSVYRDTNWLIDFAQSGEIVDSTFTDKATGVGISSTFSGGASAANSISQFGPKSDAQLDSDTLRLQSENAALKAEIDNKTLKAQLESLDNTPSKP